MTAAVTTATVFLLIALAVNLGVHLGARHDDPRAAGPRVASRRRIFAAALRRGRKP